MTTYSDTFFYLLTNPRHMLGVLIYGILLGIPGSYLTGIFTFNESILLESLFIFTLLMTAYLVYQKIKSASSPDYFRRDYYLKNLNLRENLAFRFADLMVFFIGVPLTFLFDLVSTVYFALSFFDPVLALTAKAEIVKYSPFIFLALAFFFVGTFAKLVWVRIDSRKR